MGLYRLLARRPRRPRGGPQESDRGSALVEFLGVSLILLIPLVYLVLTLGRIQAAAFASEGAAREAGRHVVRAATFEEGASRAARAVELAFADQGIDVVGREAMALACERDPCLTPGGRIWVTVESRITLPGAPAFLGDAIPAVPVSAGYVAVVDAFREAPP